MLRQDNSARATSASIALGVVLTLSACSSSGEPGPAPVAKKTEAEVPISGADLSRACADGLGFPGLPAYQRSVKALHPAVLMSNEQGSWSNDFLSTRDFPAGWIVGSADDVKKAQLVVCFERTGASRAGKTCRMRDQKTNKPLLVTMFNTAYRLRVLEARTGRTLYDRTSKAASTTCPAITFTSQNEDPTKYYTRHQLKDYRRVLKRFISA